MAEKKKCPHCYPPAPPWIMSFADLMGLLMACFALLLAFSSVSKPAELAQAMGSLQGGLGVLDGDPVLVSPISMYQVVPKTPGVGTGPGSTMTQVKSEIEEEIEEAGQGENVEVSRDSEGMTILLKDEVAFGSGQAEIKPAMRALLLQIGKSLTQTNSTVEISGHTDDVPISSGRFPNNHWLSTSRAMQVLDVFADEAGVDRRRLSAIGHGEYQPLVPNDTPANRAKNRRVEIRVRNAPGERESEQTLR
jgi:chemotaxis protein MotB